MLPFKMLSYDTKLDFSNVLIVPKKTNVISRKNVNLKKYMNFKTYNKTIHWEGVPIISSNMDTVTNLETFKVLKRYNYISCFPKHYNAEWLETLPTELVNVNNYMLSCGINDEDVNILVKLVEALDKKNIKVKFVCVDVANGYLDKVGDVLKYLRETLKDVVLVAGNVVTPEGASELIKNGANIIKIGIGNGSVCTTRLQTGVGYPQLSALSECFDVINRSGAYQISDGGIVHVGDIAKAYIGGADFVMIGGMFAGHTESPGTLHYDEKTNEFYKHYYGMASEKAVNKYNDGMKNYRTYEGKEVKIIHKGEIKNTIENINGGLRSACTYVNALDLNELRHNGRFIRVNQTHNSIYD